MHVPAVDGGLYLIKGGRPIDEPGRVLIKNDPRYNEQWPRALVPYERIYGIDEPKPLPPLANDGKLSPDLPEGTPFGLVGTSSLYKRESYPNGVVPPGSVTATCAGGNDTGGTRTSTRSIPAWTASRSTGSIRGPTRAATQRRHPCHPHPGDGADDGPHRGPKSGRAFRSHANERLRILGEIPVRKFPQASRDSQRQEDSRSIPTATPTPASSPKFPPTWPSRSRRSTGTAWC